MTFQSPSDPPPNYTVGLLVETWLQHSAVHDHAMNVDRFARYAPEVGWASILAVLALPGSRPFLWLLARPLGMLLSEYGDAFIDRIETEARRNPAFLQCLRHVHSDPVFSIPESLWDRLTVAAGQPVGPIPPHMAALYAGAPGLAETMAADLDPLDPLDAPVLSAEDLRAHAQGWVTFQESFWAWAELNRILEEDGPESTWPIVMALIARADDDAMAPLGAGVLEDMLRRHGPEVIARVEAYAASDQRFRFCLSHVWRGQMSDEIWSRVVAARGDEPQRG